MQYAQIDWQHGTPRSTAYDDIYFSRVDGPAEARHVFLDGSRLPERWSPSPGDRTGRAFVIAETGFGTGLNFLAARDLWCRHPANHAAPSQLHFVSFEKHPLHPDDLHRALAPRVEFERSTHDLLRQYRLLVPGWNRFHLGSVTLSLYIGDGCTGLADWQGRADAWFLDGFAPDRNPEFWSPALFRQLARHSHEGTTIATYTVARSVRQGLTAAGFRLTRRPGYGHKQHNLAGAFVGPCGPILPERPGRLPRWPAPRSAGSGARIAILGSGIAAAEIAHRFHLRGIPVTVIAPDPPGSAASGNRQGVLYARPGLEDDPPTRFHAAAMAYRCRHWPEDCEGAPTGVLQLTPGTRMARFRALLQASGDHRHPFAELMEPVDSDRASELAGVAITQPSLWFPAAGWLNPAELCRRLLQDIPRLQTTVLGLQASPGGWQITLADGRIPTFDRVVIACGHHSNDFAPAAELPLQPIAGQVTSSHAPTALRVAVCGAHYVAPPAADGTWTFGATFRLNDDTHQTSPEAQAENLAALAQMLPDLQPEPDGDRAGVRAATPDYLPLAGPVPRPSNALDPPSVRRGITPETDAESLYHPGLFILAGLGAKGLTTAPLLAEHLVCRILDEPSPLGYEQDRLVHPGRFIYRTIRSG